MIPCRGTTVPAWAGLRYGPRGISLRVVALASLLLFFAAEVAAFVVVGEHIGFAWAVLAVLAVSASGPFIVRRVGLGVLVRAQERLAAGELATRELLDGVVVLIGGLMICLPGFVGDTLGLALMVPPVRRVLIRVAGARLAKRVQHVRAGRWAVVEARSFPADEPEPDSDRDQPRGRIIGPGGDPGN